MRNNYMLNPDFINESKKYNYSQLFNINKNIDDLF